MGGDIRSIATPSGFEERWSGRDTRSNSTPSGFEKSRCGLSETTFAQNRLQVDSKRLLWLEWGATQIQFRVNSKKVPWLEWGRHSLKLDPKWFRRSCCGLSGGDIRSNSTPSGFEKSCCGLSGSTFAQIQLQADAKQVVVA